MFERQWTAVSNQFLTANGGADGAVTLASTAGFYVKMTVKVSSLTQQTQLLEVKRVLSPNLLYVGPLKDKIGTRTDISAYTVADLATISAAQQDRSGITQADYERFVIAEEPILAKRVIWVDQWGNYYQNSNPVPVNVVSGGGGGTPSGATNLTILNPIAAISNTEYSISIPVGTQRIRVRNKNNGRIQYSFIATQTATNFMTIFPGVTEDIGDLMLTSGTTFYFMCLQNNQVLEVMLWT